MRIGVIRSRIPLSERNQVKDRKLQRTFSNTHEYFSRGCYTKYYEEAAGMPGCHRLVGRRIGRLFPAHPCEVVRVDAQQAEEDVCNHIHRTIRRIHRHRSQQSHQQSHQQSYRKRRPGRILR